MENENGEQDILNPDVEETTNETTEETGQETEPKVDWESKAKKAEELANNYKVRAEKAEKAIKAKGGDSTPKSESGLKAEDVLELTSEGITHKEDVEMTLKWAGFNNKPVGDAIKDPMFKMMLEQKREERKTAEATLTKGGATGVKRVTGEALLEKANKGEYPQTDEDMQKMIKAKFDAKLKK